jgi:hypothetical protein
MTSSAAPKSSWLTLLAGAALMVAGCEAPRAHGDVQAVIVAASPALWDAVEMDLEDAIAPTIQVVRSERTFRVAWQDPAESTQWGNLRRFRNVLAVGAPGDFWIDEALAALPRGTVVPIGPKCPDPGRQRLGPRPDRHRGAPPRGR